MKIALLLGILLTSLPSYSQQKNQLQFFQTDWGRNVSWDAFCEKAKASGYDGIETWFPKKLVHRLAFDKALEKYDLKVIYLAGADKSVDFETSLRRYTEELMRIVASAPVAINCHTGGDFFTFEQNKAFIDTANKIAKENDIPIYHETHRSRFSFNLPDTEQYLKALPDLKLTLDISHWMVVHESLLEGQDENLGIVIDRTHHIHARVGHQEGPQVNDPAAPEWQNALNRHLDIWEKVIRKRWSENDEPFTITTEFGPPNYMPTLPYTQIPVTDQWKANIFIMEALKERMGVK
ncbi:sugar phosphate isomerase/epimerase family protein [Pricia sp.]|uniref:sugar phosphate isomerase/epimerase family protein n=1 Tax=Pricia sp. TaxID=2268138 RepID=UPI00359438C9